MRPEQQTPSQPRRRQPREIPWRCVALEGQQIVPLRLDEALNPEEFHQYQFCVHVEKIPNCTLSDEEPSQTISRSVISSDGYVYEKSALDDYHEKGGIRNRLTMQVFSPDIQYWIRFACQGLLPSKLDPRKMLDKSNPVIGFFSSRSRNNCHLIVIEKQDTHGCGYLDIYTFEQQRNRTGYTEPTITHRRFSDLEYSMLDHYLILSDYDVTESELQAKTLNTTLEIANTLECQIQDEERQLARTRIPASASQPRQAFLRISAALFGGDTAARLNTLSWCMGLLSRSGVLRTPRLNPRLETWERVNYGRLFLPPSNTNPNALACSEDDHSEISALSDLSAQTTQSAFCFPWRKKP